MLRAEVMPAEKYSFRLTPGQMTFAEWINHSSERNYRDCSTLRSEPQPEALKRLPSLKEKAEVTKELKDSFAYCAAALEKMDDQKAASSPEMSAAFLHRPRAVLVDEPMVGLDPRGARLIKDVFRRMSDRGVAILMSTHTLEVAQEMCDRISIILRGQIIARGTVEQLRELAARGTEGSDRSGNDEHLTEVFLRLTGGSGLQEIDEVL